MKTSAPQINDVVIKLIEEVDYLSDTIMEQYVPDLKEIRKIGDLTLKTASKVEDILDESIIMWAEKVGQTRILSEKINTLLKYEPLLSHIFMSGKVDVLAEYGLLKKHKDLHREIMWLNGMRNYFAHYHIYRYKLEKDFSTIETRKKHLIKLKSVILNANILKKAIESLYSKQQQ